MGANGLRHHVSRLVLSIVLAVISIGFFGFSIAVASSDVVSAELRMLYDNDEEYVVLEGKNEYVVERFVNDQRHDVVENQVTRFSATQLQTFASRTSQKVIPVSSGGPTFDNKEYYYDELFTSDDSFDTLAEQLFMKSSNAFFVNEDIVVEDLGITPDARFVDSSLCRLPSKADEVAISDLRADFYLTYGYVDENDNWTKINTVDDLIGKTIFYDESIYSSFSASTICGVYSTSEDKETLKNVTINQAEENRYNTYLSSGLHLANSVFCYQDYKPIEDIGENGMSLTTKQTWVNVQGILYHLSGSVSKDKNVVNSLTHSTAETISDDVDKNIYHHTYSAKLFSTYTGFIENAKQYLPEQVIQIMTIGSIVLCVISILLLLNFMLVSVEHRKKEIGIVRALGGRKKDAVMICLMEALCIGAIDFVMSLLGVGIACAILNSYFFISIFWINFLTWISLLVMCFASVTLSTIIPVLKESQKKIVDILK